MVHGQPWILNFKTTAATAVFARACCLSVCLKDVSKPVEKIDIRKVVNEDKGFGRFLDFNRLPK